MLYHAGVRNWSTKMQSLVFIDLETSGLSAADDRIIEVGIVHVQGQKVVQKYSTLVNPERKIEGHIKKITGINNAELRLAPKFADVAVEVMKLARKGIFVAHNAAFDYGFLEAEFARLEMPFSAPRLCTLKLSQHLFPAEQAHNLDAISARYNIRIHNRHRAMDDALATWFFYQKITDMLDPYALALAWNQVFQEAKAPKVNAISRTQLSLLG
jgi:DNA polymerase-3 subunit epsilon